MTKSLEERVSELEGRLAKLETRATTAALQHIVPIQKKVSAKEFLLTKTIKTDIHKTLVLAYYLEQIGGSPSFNINDLSLVYKAAKEIRPGNLSDTVGKNMARGFFMEVPERKNGKKAWTLTTTGEKYVEKELTNNQN